MADWFVPFRFGMLACYYKDDPPVNMTLKSRLLAQLNECDNFGAKKVPPTYPDPLFGSYGSGCGFGGGCCYSGPSAQHCVFINIKFPHCLIPLPPSL